MSQISHLRQDSWRTMVPTLTRVWSLMTWLQREQSWWDVSMLCVYPGPMLTQYWSLWHHDNPGASSDHWPPATHQSQPDHCNIGLPWPLGVGIQRSSALSINSHPAQQHCSNATNIALRFISPARNSTLDCKKDKPPRLKWLFTRWVDFVWFLGISWSCWHNGANNQ